MQLGLITSLLALATPLLAKNVDLFPGYHNLQFDISRGDSFQDSSKNKYPRLVRRAVDGTVITEIENQSTFYSVLLKMGSENEEVIVLIDTGSSDLWVSSSTNPYCESNAGSSKKYRELNDEASFLDSLTAPTSNKLEKRDAWRVVNDDDSISNINVNVNQEQNDLLATASVQNKAVSATSGNSIATIDCNEYGTFDYTASTTFRSNGTEFYISYGDRTYALGTWGYDNVNFGGLDVENLSFAVANQSNSSMGVLGIGLQGLETTYTGVLSRDNPYTYANLPIKLVQDGLIHSPAYSLYLNDYSASTGNVLFGGVDHAKYYGTLQTVPVVNTLASAGYKNPIKLQITLNSITLNSHSNQVSIFSGSTPALLDSGTTLTYLPSSIVSSIASSIGASYSSTYGYYLLNCPSSSVDLNITYNFQGIEINVPITEVLLAADTSGSVCALAMIPSDNIILGDSFLRSAYVVYDLANYQIALAQARFTTEENIEVITSTIPSATPVSDYSSTATTGIADTTAATTRTTFRTATASSTRRSTTNADGAGSMVAVPSVLSLFVGLILMF